MTDQVDEKKYVIIALLIKLREFDPSIGKYIGSSRHESEHLVKLHNGKIILSQQMLEDFERNNSLLNEKTLRMAAFSFVPNEPQVNTLSSKLQRSPFSNVGNSTKPVTMERSDSRVQKAVLILVVVLLIVLAIYLSLR